MNIINKLTIKHLKKNKRRTIITIIGVIISVAMMMAVVTLVISTLVMLQKSTRNYTGDWEVAYQDVVAEKISTIENDSNTDHLIIEDELGFAKLDQKAESGRPYLYITAVNQVGFDYLPLTLTKGTFPQTNEEIVVSDQLKDVAVGDCITLKMGKRMTTDEDNQEELGNSLYEPYNPKEETFVEEDTKTYRVTGFINTDLMKYSSASELAYSTIQPLTRNKHFNVKVGLKKIDHALYEDSILLRQKINNESVSYNDELLKYYGVTDDKGVNIILIQLTMIVGFIILVGSVVLIYNVFMISLSERSRHLGMLASIGATKKQKRNAVFFEGVLVGAIAIPVGLVAGIIGIGISLRFVNPIMKNALGSTEDIQVIISPLALSATVIFSCIIILISTWIPALKASRISPIDAIRQMKDYHPKSKPIRSSKIVRSFFGFEAELGLKNIKRNRQRYLATLFSMVISIVLFLSTVTFTHLISSSLKMSYENTNEDLQVTIHNLPDPADMEDYLQRYHQISKIDHIVQAETLLTTTKLDGGKVHQKVKEHYPANAKQVEIGVSIISLDDETMKEVYQAANIDKEAFEKQEMSGILFDRVSFHDKIGYEELNISTLKAQDEIVLDENNDGSDQEQISQTLKLIQTSNAQLSFVDHIQEFPELTIIVSKPTMKKMIGKQSLEHSYHHVYNLLIQTKDARLVEEQVNELAVEYPKINSVIYNVQEMKQRDKEINLLFTFFIYCFIGLITVISIASISNTLTTSIHLRKREFAMLKSVGLTPKGFSKMIRFESLFYGLKALLYGLPLSFFIMYFLYRVMGQQFNSGLYIPWLSVGGVVLVVFVLTSVLMYYSTRKMKMDSIVESVKNENT